MTEIGPAYLDWNATAPVPREVADAMADALARCGNASSVHRWGRAARQAIEQARSEVAALAGAPEDEIVFTGSGSEANQTALRGFPGRRVLVSALEHDSVRLAVAECELVPALGAGTVDLAALERMLSDDSRPALVSLMLANNETGAIQPVAEAAHIAHAAGALIHCDAVQAAGRIALDKDALGADLVTLSAHKIGGPQGVGALVVSPDLPLAPLIAGGGQERGRRAGTENVAGIVGFGVAARLACARLGDQARIAALRDRAERRLLAVAPEARIFARDVARLANTLCIAMPGVPAATQVMALDLAGVMVSAGAACSSGKVRRSPTLEAMGVAPDLADCAIRISLGWSTSDADIDHLVEAWGALHARVRAHAA
ncbi:MAG TPA: cysteine desulfurase family protein [Stellaceae bacterium]|nr:cysteine desulfurase family protein [Stellaceae bacterium]